MTAKLDEEITIKKIENILMKYVPMNRIDKYYWITLIKLLLDDFVTHRFYYDRSVTLHYWTDLKSYNAMTEYEHVNLLYHILNIIILFDVEFEKKYAGNFYINNDNNFLLLYAAALHDVGKNSEISLMYSMNLKYSVSLKHIGTNQSQTYYNNFHIYHSEISLRYCVDLRNRVLEQTKSDNWRAEDVFKDDFALIMNAVDKHHSPSSDYESLSYCLAQLDWEVRYMEKHPEFKRKIRIN